MSFAGNAVATPTLQQSEEARRLTVCVIYGHDIIPRLGSLSITKLMDDLSDAGVYSLMKKAVARTKSAVTKSAGETPHDNQYYPMWRGLPDGGTCAGCGRECAERPPRASDIRRGRRRACSQTRNETTAAERQKFSRERRHPSLRFAIGSFATVRRNGTRFSRRYLVSGDLVIFFRLRAAEISGF